MKIKFLESFTSKIDQQIDYIAKDKPLAARTFKQNVFSLISDIPKFPYKHRKSIYFDNSEIRDLVYKGYKIIYRINNENNTIEIFGFINMENKLKP